MSAALTNLIGALCQARPDWTVEALADALWLNQWFPAPAVPFAPPAPTPPEQPLAEAEPPTPALPDRPEPWERKKEEPAPAHAANQASGSAGLRLPNQGQSRGQTGSRTFRTPAAAALPDALALVRALRPLRRRVRSRYRFAIDEEATVRLAAEEDIYVPVVRPVRERWLRLELVVDTSAAMGVWRQTVAEFRAALRWLCAFRDVRVWSLDTDVSPPRFRAGLTSVGSSPILHDPSVLLDPSGCSLVLVVSQCVAAAWHDGSVARVLETWASGPMALLQMLPEHLWSRSALGQARPVRLTAGGTAVPNHRLRAESEDLWLEDDDQSGTPMPVTALEPQSLGAWARLVAGVPGGDIAGFEFALKMPSDDGTVERTEPPPEDGSVNKTEPTPESRLNRFRLAASPLARRLAGLLAASPTLSLPVMRLVRAVLLPEARQFHEAEVLLGGLLRVVADAEDPEEVRYDFHLGVRTLLLNALPSARALDVLERVSAFVQERLGQARDFRALLADPDASVGSLDPDESPFAHVAADVLERLGGSYAWLVRPPENKISFPKVGEVITNGLGMSFAWVPPGESWLGGGGGKPGEQSFSLKQGLWCGVYPVTQAEWQAVMGNNPSHFKGNPRCPVECVSWNDVQEFLTLLNEKCSGDGLLYRLPTQEEWEYICRGGPASKSQSAYDFYFARSRTDLTPAPTNDLCSTQANFDGNYPAGSASKGPYLERTSEVRLYLPNPLGIYDLHGNVWEWTASEAGSSRLFRGGSWDGVGPGCTASRRGRNGPGIANQFIGFRVLAVPSAR